MIDLKSGANWGILRGWTKSGSKRGFERPQILTELIFVTHTNPMKLPYLGGQTNAAFTGADRLTPTKQTSDPERTYAVDLTVGGLVSLVSAADLKAIRTKQQSTAHAINYHDPTSEFPGN